MNRVGWQISIAVTAMIVALWVVVFLARSAVYGDPVAQAADTYLPPADRREVGADTGTIQALAYSEGDGDAYVRIEGNTVYAEARLNGPIATSTLPPAMAQSVAPQAPTPFSSQPAAQGAVNLTVASVANVRSAPWSTILGTVNPGERYTPNGIALPWYRFVWQGQEAWIHSNLISVNGDTATLPVVSVSVAEPVAAVQPVSQPMQASAPPPSEPVASLVEVQSYPFLAIPAQLEDEANNPSFYAQVVQNGNPAPGRYCVVFHDGVEVGRSESLNVFDETNKGTPWTDDDRPYNCEVKFYDHNPQAWTGVWVIELWDSVGSIVGRSESFTLNQTQQQAWISFSGF